MGTPWSQVSELSKQRRRDKIRYLYNNDPEYRQKVLDRNKKSRLKHNPPRDKTQNKTYDKKAYYKAYREANREKIRLYMRKYYWQKKMLNEFFSDETLQLLKETYKKWQSLHTKNTSESQSEVIKNSEIGKDSCPSPIK